MCTGNPRVQQHRNRRYRHKATLPLPLGDDVVFTRISSRGSLRGVLAAPAAPPRGSRLGLQAQERRHGDSNTSPVGSGPRSVTGGRLPADSGGGAGAAATPPRGGAQLGARGPARPRSAAAGAQRRRHVFRGQRERPAARGGAAQARGRRGEDQGLPGGRRTPAVLHAERVQGRAAGGRASRKQPLPGAPLVCFALSTARKKFAEQCLRAQSEE